MPIHYADDLMPRNAPIPAPLLEVAATPLVPEVSLLLDLDRNKSLHLQTPLVNYTKGASNSSPAEEQKSMSRANQKDACNAWKAKNMHLSSVTRSSEIPERFTKDSSLAGSNGVQRRMSSEKEICSFPDGKHVGESHTLRQANRGNQLHTPEAAFQGFNTNFGHQPSQNIDRHHIDYPNMQVFYGQPVDSYSQCRSGDTSNPQQYQYPIDHSVQHKPTIQTAFSADNQNKDFPNVQFYRQPITNIPFNLDYVPTYNTNHCNSNNGQCHCGIDNCRRTTNDKEEYTHSQTSDSKDEGKSNKRIPSHLDVAHVNNQSIKDLFHIVNIQQEQISLLQQQVNKVLQIHSDCTRIEQNYNCQRCQCNRRNNCISDKPSCVNAQKDCNFRSNLEHSVCDKIEINERAKRSIGVMTSVAEPNEDNHASNASKTKSTTLNIKKKQINNNSKGLTHNYPSHSKQVVMLNKVDEKRRKSSKMPIKLQRHEHPKLDNSFSLNETELIIKTSSDQGDLSPDSSVHVDLQDYNSSSSERHSEDSASSSSENEENQHSDSDDNSSVQQPSWTLYGRILGQIDNIIMKNPTPPRQEQLPNYRTPAGNLYGLNPEYEAENNWSKRVTFDGPLLDDSDHNLGVLPKYDQHQDMIMTDGRGRMQDFMMYNFANGNTNLSFASMRYLDRHHKVQAQRTSKPDQIYHQTYQTSSKKHKKKKSKEYQKFSDSPAHFSKRKGGTPIRKLLDTNAFKQQPTPF